MRSRITLVLLALSLGLSASLAFSQSEFPTRPIRLLVGFAPGGSTDVLGRTLAQEARVTLGQQIIVVNRPGASGAIAIKEVIAAPPDGYTLGLGPISAFTLAFHFTDIPPDMLDRIEPLLMVGRQRLGMVVRSDSPHKSLKDLVEFAKKNPGKVSFGIPGLGSNVEIFTREIMRQANAEAVFVPFKGDADVSTALLGGQIGAGSLSAAGFSQQIKAGKMRLLASYQSDRYSIAPEVPTLEELGYGLTATSIQFLYGPKGLPPTLSKRLTQEFTKATASRLYIDIATKNDLYEKELLSGDALNAYLLKDRAKNQVLIEKLGMKKQ